MVTEGGNLNFILRRDGQKTFYERRDYQTVAGKQRFNTARTKLRPFVIQ